MLAPLTKGQCRRLARPFGHRWDREYSYWKLRTDPLYPSVARALLEVDDGQTGVLDIGCGLGLFACYLREAGFRGPILGIDYDERKIRAAQERLAVSKDASADLRFVHGDVRETLPTFHGHVTILDVLQYLESNQQQDLLRLVTASLAPGGCLVIRSGLAQNGWRFRVTRLADWFAHGCLWMKGRPVSYPEKGALEATLGEAGLVGGFRPLWGRTPFNNYLGVFHRRPETGERPN